MKTQRQNFRACQASALFTTLIIVAAVGLVLIAYLLFFRTQYHSTVRAQEWQRALVVAESGVEEALAHLNSGPDDINRGLTNNFDVNGWTGQLYGTNLLRITKTTQLDNGVTYTMVVSNLTTTRVPEAPVIVSTATVPGPVSSSPLYRTVCVQITNDYTPDDPYQFAVVERITMTGNKNITGVWFNSTNANRSTNGRYDPAKAGDEAILYSASPNVAANDLAKSLTKGRFHTRASSGLPGGSTYSVGSSNWVPSVGIESGRISYNVPVPFPQSPPPPPNATSAPLPTSGTIEGVTYKYILGASGNYSLPALDGGLYVASGVNATLRVDGNVSVSGNTDAIYLAANSSLKLWVMGNSVSLGGKVGMNRTGLAKNLILYGNTNTTDITLGGNAEFLGIVRATNAVLTIGGGGNWVLDWMGASKTREVRINGHFNMHMDEALGTGNPTNYYRVIAWKEL